MVNRIFMIVLMLFGLLIGLFTEVQAQDFEYEIHVRKDFGYNMGSNIQGRFSVSVLGEEENVAHVTFYIDNTVLQRVERPPFKYQFNTEGFDPGIHRLYADVQLIDGRTEKTSVVQYTFLSQKEASKQITTVLIGIGGAVVGTLLIVALIQGLVINRDGKPRHQSGTPRNYGLLGGTICRKCGRSFPRHIWGINLVVGRLDRCDHCGKWSMTIRATPKALRMAEEAEQESFDGGSLEVPVPVDNKDLLEETKYFDDI